MATNRELVEEAELAAAITAQELAFVSALGLAPYPDGNSWCVLWGEDLQSGVAGFGDTPILAVYAFNKAVQSAKAREASHE